jgi:hypothetical protein
MDIVNHPNRPAGPITSVIILALLMVAANIAAILLMKLLGFL